MRASGVLGLESPEPDARRRELGDGAGRAGGVVLDKEAIGAIGGMGGVKTFCGTIRGAWAAVSAADSLACRVLIFLVRFSTFVASFFFSFNRLKKSLSD